MGPADFDKPGHPTSRVAQPVVRAPSPKRSIALVELTSTK
jgi:hypothetical protein